MKASAKSRRTHSMEEHNEIWELLAKRLSGEILPGERRELNALMNGMRDEEVEFMINALKQYAESIQNAPENNSIRAISDRCREEALSVIEEIENSKKAPAMIYPVKKKRRLWWAAAAAVLLLLGVSFFLIVQKDNRSALNVVTTKDGSRSTIVLPDGTEVQLNADSRIAYANNFKDAPVREVTLSGEAYFKVNHDSAHPFVIHTKYLTIKDLGTTFNVRAYPEEDKSETTLIKGSITVSLKEHPEKNMLLKPGEKLLFYTRGQRLTKERKNRSAASIEKDLKPIPKLKVAKIKPVVIHPGDTVISETAWIHNQLVFTNESFSDLVKRMNRFYNVKIVINGQAVKNYSFTGVFMGETLQQALEELQMIRPFSFTMNKNKVVIRSKK